MNILDWAREKYLDIDWRMVKNQIVYVKGDKYGSLVLQGNDQDKKAIDLGVEYFRTKL